MEFYSLYFEFWDFIGKFWGLSRGSHDQNFEKKFSLKFGQINFRKSQKISNRFDNALKSY